jgi:RNA polymerase sigma-70 factor, ECF subfamily
MLKLYNAFFVNEMVGVYNKRMEKFVQEHLKSVYNYVFRIIKSESGAEDVTQETFVKIWRHHTSEVSPPAPSYVKRGENLKPWIFKIARNTAIDYLRKRKNVLFSEIDSLISSKNSEENGKSFEENIPDIEPLPDEIFIRKELAQELENALSQIRPDFAEIIFLHYNQNMTFEEIGKVVGKPLNTVKSHHLRALQAIRKILINQKHTQSYQHLA